ncbi:uncharacterized protein DUF262 [Pseudomonas sp. SLBN-26]|uniref:DUF262 domain-containing protein n=1 Tax=Pseudomonadaceae TaxID=135621 RepID=UPI00114F91FD|nr:MULTISPECIES: DUF262 domain-containing protein [Pseudomonas]MCP1620144.1 uncharacterized protein with ParB-like and HNH nuclease domain [Pseudomonas otitidis]TQL09364.1 uncharacterized protein DUF262 [Pseudomonas sp. SLBN-26]
MDLLDPPITLNMIDEQISEFQSSIAYDTKEYVVEVLIKRFKEKKLFVPQYQRQFVWPEQKKSKFIESVLMGLPIPFMFGVQCDDGTVEILDGAQRIQTLEQFVDGNLRLKNLERLDLLDDLNFNDLPSAQQNKFLDRPLRMVVLPSTVSLSVRLDMFERINTGSYELKASEIRRGAYAGAFSSFIEKCIEEPLFNKLCPMSEKSKSRREREELILRFFAYSENYRDFKHSVTGFLNEYLVEKNKSGFEEAALLEQFKNTLRYVEQTFEGGFAKSPTATSTPRVRFEALAIGCNLALKANPNLKIIDGNILTESKEFLTLTTSHGSNSGPRLRARIDYVKDFLLEMSK